MQTITKFEAQKRYRMRAVTGEVAIKENDNGTRSVEVMCEVTAGPLQTERVRYRGYLNTAANAERAANDLRVMGWRGQRWGDWSGIGSREFQGTTMLDVNAETGKTYARVAFVSEVPTISDKGKVDAAAIDELNKLFAPPPPPRATSSSSTANGAAAPPPSAEADAAGGDEIPF